MCDIVVEMNRGGMVVGRGEEERRRRKGEKKRERVIGGNLMTRW